MEIVQDLIFGEIADAWETIEIVVLRPESGLVDESGSFGNANDLLRGEDGMELDFSIDLLELEALAGFRFIALRISLGITTWSWGDKIEGVMRLETGVRYKNRFDESN